MRLDLYLVEKNLASSRSKAQNYIKNKKVKVNGKIVTKPSFEVFDDEVVLEDVKDYVSRAGFKIKYFLDEIDLDIKDKECLDVGSSTGGFSEVLLEYGAKEVVCVDVGKNQLHPKIKNDKRVLSFEETDIREFEFYKKFDLVVSDVSFISVLKILDDILRFAKNEIIILFKPQFEVGKSVKRDKNGVVVDNDAIQKAMIDFENECKGKDLELIKKSPSKLTGKDGNQEWLYFFKIIKESFNG